jgi:hypothetical protein
LSSLSTSISPGVGSPSIATSGDTGCEVAPATVSSSAAINDPPCTVRRCGRNSISAARSAYGSSHPSITLRRITCTSWLMNNGGVSPTPPRTRSR